MAYLDTAQRGPRPGAIVATVAIHAGIGALLVTGLGVAITERESKDKFEAHDVPLPKPPPPPPEPQVDPQTPPKAAPDIFVPQPKIPMPPRGPVIESAPKPNLGETIRIPIPSGGPGKLPPLDPPSATPSFDPVAPVPANDRGGWVTQSDYRSSWIRREYTGTVGFRVGVGVDGRVGDCTVTRSSGHAALDDATCRLVSSRARFEPALDSSRKAVAGSYSGSVRWELPE